MAKFTTSTLTTEIELITTPCDRKVLNTRFEMARIVCNAVLCEGLRRRSQMQESKDYRAAQKLPKGEEPTAAFKEVTKKMVCMESIV